MKLHLHHFSKIRSKKKSQNSRNQGFSYYFCMMIEGSGAGSRAGSGSGSIPQTSGSGSGSGRPKNTWIRWIRIRIRIRIRNTGLNPKDAKLCCFSIRLGKGLFSQDLIRFWDNKLQFLPECLHISKKRGQNIKNEQHSGSWWAVKSISISFIDQCQLGNSILTFSH